MGAGEYARTTYDAARQEVLQRMRLRDHALLAYLGFIGAIFSVALSQNNKEILLSIPFITLGISIIMSQHYMMAAIIGTFCTNELEEFLLRHEPNEYAPQWDNSYTFKNHAATSALFRVLGHSIIISVPCFIALGVNWLHIMSPFPFGIAWWFGLVCFLGATWVIRYAHIVRTEIYKTRQWRSSSST